MVKFGKEFRKNQIELFKNKYINYKKTENGMELELVYEVLEKIGTKEKLNI